MPFEFRGSFRRAMQRTPVDFLSPAFEEHKKVVVVKLSYRQSFTLAIESVPFNVSQDLFSNSISSPQMILMPY